MVSFPDPILSGLGMRLMMSSLQKQGVNIHLNVPSPHPLSLPLFLLLPSSPYLLLLNLPSFFLSLLLSLSPWQVSGVSNNMKLYEWIKSHQKK